MSFVNFASREVQLKIVYYGPGLCGKTTNLQVIHRMAPSASRGSLTVARRPPPPPPAVSVAGLASPAPAPGTGMVTTVPSARRRRRRTTDAAKPRAALAGPLTSVGLTLLFAGAFSAAVYATARDAAWMTPYLYGRAAALAVAVLAVVHDAFRESAARGLLALFFPPYLIFHALTHVEQRWRTALLLGVAAMLGLEMRLLPKRALLPAVQRAANRGIDWVGGQIQRAGEASYE